MVAHGKALQRLWKDKLTVVEYLEVTKANGSTGFEEVAVLQNVSCKLSFSTLRAVNQNDANATIVQAVKVFCDPALNIDAGSKLVIEHNGRIFEFGRSGEPGVFSDHQEIVLVPFGGWA
jgi:hypothetical protein